MPRLEFTYRSRFFTSIKEACKHYDVSYVLTRKHMKDYHISVGEALDIERNKIKDHNGVSFRTYREMCDFHGIPYRRFQTRFYHGYSMRECLSGGFLPSLPQSLSAPNAFSFAFSFSFPGNAPFIHILAQHTHSHQILSPLQSLFPFPEVTSPSTSWPNTHTHTHTHTR